MELKSGSAFLCVSILVLVLVIPSYQMIGETTSGSSLAMLSASPLESPSPVLTADCEDGNVRLSSKMNSSNSVTGVLEICLNGLFTSVCSDSIDFDAQGVQAQAALFCEALELEGGMFLPPLSSRTSGSNEVITNLSCSSSFINFMESCEFTFTQDPSCLDHSQDLILQCLRDPLPCCEIGAQRQLSYLTLPNTRCSPNDTLVGECRNVEQTCCDCCFFGRVFYRTVGCAGLQTVNENECNEIQVRCCEEEERNALLTTAQPAVAMTSSLSVISEIESRMQITRLITDSVSEGVKITQLISRSTSTFTSSMQGSADVSKTDVQSEMLVVTSAISSLVSTPIVTTNGETIATVIAPSSERTDSEDKTVASASFTLTPSLLESILRPPLHTLTDVSPSIAVSSLVESVSVSIAVVATTGVQSQIVSRPTSTLSPQVGTVLPTVSRVITDGETIATMITPPVSEQRQTSQSISRQHSIISSVSVGADHQTIGSETADGALVSMLYFLSTF